MSIAPVTDPVTSPSLDPVEVLIKEARRRGRLHLAIGLLTCALVAGSVVATIVRIGSPAPTGSSPTSSIPTGAVATVDRMGHGSSIFAIDMLSTTHGFGIAGRPGQGSPSYLVATSTAGRTWIVRSRLPFSLLNDGLTVPSLLFLDERVGYAQSGIATGGDEGPSSDRDVFVTTDGGFAWRPLSIGGVTPTAAGDDLTAGSVNESYQVAGGVVSLVALRCTGAELLQGGSVCPSELEQFKVGSVRPAPSSSPKGISKDGARCSSRRLRAGPGPCGPRPAARSTLEPSPFSSRSRSCTSSGRIAGCSTAGRTRG